MFRCFHDSWVSPLRSSRKEPAARRYRLLGHVRQISPNARDGGYWRALSRIFYYAKRYIHAYPRAIFTPACAASFAFYRAATRYLEYTLGGCISHSAVLYTLFFCARRIRVRTTVSLRAFLRTSEHIVTREISWKYHRRFAIEWKIEIYSVLILSLRRLLCVFYF